MTSPDIVDIMRSIVSDLSDAMGYTVHFEHGHMIEITNVVKDLAQNPDISNRYPLIALKQDVKQNKKSQVTEMDFTLYIITLSKPTYMAQERIDNIFEPYLRPIKDELISQMAASGSFDHTEDELNDIVTFYERLFWGKAQVMGNDANIFGDWVDCIEVEFSGLKVFNSCEAVVHIPKLIYAFVYVNNEYYLIFDTQIINPTANKDQIVIKINGIPDVVQNVVLLSNDNKIVIMTVDHELLPEDVITISAPAGTFESTEGIGSIDYVDYPVTNMV